jgi:hypothetical protein
MPYDQHLWCEHKGNAGRLCECSNYHAIDYLLPLAKHHFREFIVGGRPCPACSVIVTEQFKKQVTIEEPDWRQPQLLPEDYYGM